ncbi:MAG: hypothetical protein J6386_12830 [Candidatus Synoicihabitans palmerolidicus]|nr:hypothetical protein [Candidatus Synoicihabitans palmerolidicus]
MKLAPTRCLRSSLLALFLAVTALSASAADMVPLGHTYPRINLTNGRILKNVVLNGFNREAGLIYVLENRQLKPYPLALFPGFVTNRINSTAAEHPAPAIRRPSPSAPARSSASPAKAAPTGPGTSAAIAAQAEATLQAAPSKQNRPPDVTFATK